MGKHNNHNNGNKGGNEYAHGQIKGSMNGQINGNTNGHANEHVNGTDMGLELKMMKALKEDENGSVSRDSRPQITRGAYTKDMLYAKIVSKVAGSGTEAYAYLVKPAEAFDDIIRDIYIAEDQDASAAYIHVTPEGVSQAANAINAMGNEIIGWTHSHGSLGVFHSGTDVNNFEVILHSIANWTKYKKEIGDCIVQDNTLYIDGYRIENISPKNTVESNGDQAETKIRVIKKADRDPFAYSIVVNDRGEYYCEKQTKRWDSLNNQFVMQRPEVMRLNIVDVENDITVDATDLEWEVRQKIRTSRYDRYDHNPTHKNDNGKFNWNFLSNYRFSHIIDKFMAGAVDHIKDNGQYSKFMAEMLLAPEDKSRLELLRNAETGMIENSADTLAEIENKKSEIKSTLEEFLNKTEIRKFLHTDSKLKRAEQENKLLVLSMLGITRGSPYMGGERGNTNGIVDASTMDSTAGKTDYQATAIKKYSTHARFMQESAQLAEGAIKSMSRYVMEEFTDYRKEQDHKYKRLLFNVLEHLKTESSYTLLDALKAETETSRQGRLSYIKPIDILLMPERKNIFNQLMSDAYNLKTGAQDKQSKRLLEFLGEFASTYLNEPGKVDGIIEKKLLSLTLKPSEYTNYQDRSIRNAYESRIAEERRKAEEERKALQAIREEARKKAEAEKPAYSAKDKIGKHYRFDKETVVDAAQSIVRRPAETRNEVLEEKTIDSAVTSPTEQKGLILGNYVLESVEDDAMTGVQYHLSSTNAGKIGPEKKPILYDAKGKPIYASTEYQSGSKEKAKEDSLETKASETEQVILPKDPLEDLATKIKQDIAMGKGPISKSYTKLGPGYTTSPTSFARTYNEPGKPSNEITDANNASARPGLLEWWNKAMNKGLEMIGFD